MKTKLLKKVRKRFSIYHLPNGFVYENKHYNYNLLVLKDNDKGDSILYNDYVQLGGSSLKEKFSLNILESKKEGIDFLKNKIIKRLENEGYRKRVKKLPENKVWY